MQKGIYKYRTDTRRYKRELHKEEAKLLNYKMHLVIRFVLFLKYLITFRMQDALDMDKELSKDYGEHSNKFAIVFTIIYLGMVAEENKVGTKLGKRIKRLGIHQVLYDRYFPTAAANFSRGLPWTRIDNECKLRGF